ncbi:MAG: Gfo/Idh/MocA family protein, partial [Acetanaerobacterium sp.]
MKDIVNWGVLGCAGIAKSTVIPSILGAANANLYAIASRGPEKLELFTKLFQPEKTYVGYDELLDDPLVDVVYIPLPNALHCEWVIKACEKKKHVLCEKPLAMNAREVEEIEQAARKNHVVVMEAFAYLHGPLMDKVREILAGGRLGRIKYMESNFSYLLTDMNNVRMIKDIGGGATYDLGCYPISFFREVVGEEPDRVLPVTTVGETSRVDEDVMLMLSFPGGAKACSYYSFQSYRSV